jgi:hypothetical protein
MEPAFGGERPAQMPSLFHFAVIFDIYVDKIAVGSAPGNIRLSCNRILPEHPSTIFELYCQRKTYIRARYGKRIPPILTYVSDLIG